VFVNLVLDAMTVFQFHIQHLIVEVSAIPTASKHVVSTGTQVVVAGVIADVLNEGGCVGAVGVHVVLHVEFGVLHDAADLVRVVVQQLVVGPVHLLLYLDVVVVGFVGVGLPAGQGLWSECIFVFVVVDKVVFVIVDVGNVG